MLNVILEFLIGTCIFIIFFIYIVFLYLYYHFCDEFLELYVILLPFFIFSTQFNYLIYNVLNNLIA